MKRKKKKIISQQKTHTTSWVFKAVFVALGMCTVFFGAYLYLSLNTKVCANSISCINDLSGAFESNATEGVFLGKTVAVPDYLAKIDTPRAVLGEKIGVTKHIYVDLTNQKLYAMENDEQVFTFPVSTGKWGRTPTGEFTIWVKLKYTRMSGGNPAIGTYYNLPNVPYTMFYFNKDTAKSEGYSIHGAYWHDNFGHPMSHGCVNMRIPDAEKLFYWAMPESIKSTTYASLDTPGTKVTVYGKAPLE